MEIKNNLNYLTINEQKEELNKWRKELEKNLTENYYKKKQLFIVSEYWFDKYIKYISNSKIDPNKYIEISEEIKEDNNELFSSFTENKINIKELPQIYIINKIIWKNIINEFNDLLTITTEGVFSNKLLTLNVLKSIYCFVFLDKNNELRQGYIKILNDSNEVKIIENLRVNGIYKFLKEKNISIDDDTVEKKENDLEIYIFKSLKNKKEKYNLFKDVDEDEGTGKLIRRRRLNTTRPTHTKKIKDEIIIFFGTRVFNVKRNKKIDEKEKMGELKKLRTLFFKYSINIKDEKIQETDKKNEVEKKKDFKKEENQKSGETQVIEKENHHQKNLTNKQELLKGQPNQINIISKKAIKRAYIPGVIGLQNIGATCYMNATIQCFSNIKRFREILLNSYKYLSQNKKDKKLSFALAEVFRNLWVDIENKEYPPIYFKDTLGEMNPLFKGIAANDPKDLVIFLLETIHKELNFPSHMQMNNNFIINTSNFNDVFNEFIQHFTNNNNSIVCEEFYGCSNSMTTCAKCYTTIHNVQVLNILFFPLEEVRKYMYPSQNSVKIEDCFLHYEKQEIYPSFYCNFCRQLFPAYNQTKLIYAPPTLIINLNRGRGIQYNVGIEFGENLDIMKYVYAQESPNYYELVGVICHFGTNDMGGHFIAFCKNVDNCKWFKYNDGIVTLVSFKDIKQGGLPYVLFYSYIKR